MGTKLYIGNLSYSTDEKLLFEIFSKRGTVKAVKIIKDRETGRGRGFAFVEMSTSDEANQSVQDLDGTDCGGRPMRVGPAKPESTQSSQSSRSVRQQRC